MTTGIRIAVILLALAIFGPWTPLMTLAACPPGQGPCTIPRVLDLKVPSAGLIGRSGATSYFVDGVKVRYEAFVGKPKGAAVPASVTVQVQYLRNGTSFKSVSVTLKQGQTLALPQVALPAGTRPISECSSGRDRITVTIDPTNRVKETNERNNSAAAGGIIC